MKKIFFGVLLAMAAVSCIAQVAVIRGSGKVQRGAFDISPDYTELTVQSGIRVVLVSSETGEGTISADEKIFDYISIEQNAGRVNVSYYPRVTFRSLSVETVVTMPISKASMTLLKASSAAKIVSDETIESGSLTINGSSAADFEFDVKAGRLALDMNSAASFKGDLEADEVVANLSSSANFNGAVVARRLDVEANSAAEFLTSGRADESEVDVSSAGRFKGLALDSKRADVDVSSGGFTELTVIDDFDVKVSSGGSVAYKGSPRIRQNVSSGGSLRSLD